MEKRDRDGTERKIVEDPHQPPSRYMVYDLIAEKPRYPKPADRSFDGSGNIVSLQTRLDFDWLRPAGLTAPFAVWHHAIESHDTMRLQISW